MTDAELRTLWREAPLVMSPAIWRALRIVLLLGRRTSEISDIARHEVMHEREPPVLLIPANREGNKAKQEDIVPLPPMVVAIIREALAIGKTTDPLFVGAHGRSTVSHEFTDFHNAMVWPGKSRIHDDRTMINDQMARMKVPSEMRSRTLHHTGDLRALVNSTYSAYDHIDEQLRAFRLWQARLRNIVNGKKLHTLRWCSAPSTKAATSSAAEGFAR